MRRGIVFKTLRVVVVIVLSLVIAAFLLKMRPMAERKVVTDTGRLVEVFPAELKSLSMVIESYGTLKPRDILDLSAEVRGRVVTLHSEFEEGGFVASGEAILAIDPRNYRLEVERQESQLGAIAAEKARVAQEVRNLNASTEIARSDTALAKAEFERVQKLSSRKVTARTTRDQAEQRYLASLERIQGLENQLALAGPALAGLDAQEQTTRVALLRARLDLERTRIIAPFDGWIVHKAVEIGSYVNIGQVVGRMYRRGHFEVDVHIPFFDMKWFGTPFDPLNGPRAVIAFHSGEQVHEWHGRVVRFKAAMDAKTRTLPVVVAVAEEPSATAERGIARLRPGMFVTVEIEGRRVENVLVLPRHVGPFRRCGLHRVERATGDPPGTHHAPVQGRGLRGAGYRGGRADHHDAGQRSR